MRFVFLYQKYKMQPFNIKFVVVILFFLVSVILTSFLPQLYFINDIIFRSAAFTVAFVALLYIFRISDDFNVLAKGVWNYLKNKFKILRR